MTDLERIKNLLKMAQDNEGDEDEFLSSKYYASLTILSNAIEDYLLAIGYWVKAKK